jgi:hypothetical protein
MSDESNPEKRGPGRPPGAKTGSGKAAQEKAAAARTAADVRRGSNPPAWMSSSATILDPRKPAAPIAEHKPTEAPKETLSKNLDELVPKAAVDRSKGAALRMGSKGPGFANWIGMAIQPGILAFEELTTKRDPESRQVLKPGINLDDNRGPLFCHDDKGKGEMIQSAKISAILAVTGGEALAYALTGDDEKDAPLLMLVGNLIVVAGLIAQQVMTGKPATIKAPSVREMIATQQALDKAERERVLAEAEAAAKVVTNGHNAAANQAS